MVRQKKKTGPVVSFLCALQLLAFDRLTEYCAGLQHTS